MKAHVIALAAGALVGVVYGLINVRSPAPPVIGLVGLIGMLLGEQTALLVRREMAPPPLAISQAGKARGSPAPEKPAPLRIPSSQQKGRS